MNLKDLIRLTVVCLVSIGISIGTSPPRPREKPGTCPPSPSTGLCVERCSSDSGCPGLEKCCSNGCGHVCKQRQNGKWTHLAEILGNRNHSCVGSLVHGCYVLTAKHCVQGVALGDLKVRLGGFNRQYSAFKVVHHSSYDAALIVINPRANALPGFIAPIDLASSDPGIETVASTVTDNSGQSEVEVPIADPDLCNTELPKSVETHEICVGREVSQHVDGLCPGHSGTPLVVQVRPGVWELAGILSHGNPGCPRHGRSAVYLSAATIRDWVRFYLPPASSNPGSTCVCALPATKHDGSPIPATHYTANCYLGPAREGCGDGQGKSFIYANSFRIVSNEAILCPAGTFDGCNCRIGDKPPGGFIYENGFYQTVPRSSGRCPQGTSYDGSNCLISKAAWATNAFIYNDRFYTTPKKQCAEPNQFAFDGVNCRFETAPGPGPFIHNRSFCSLKRGSSCPRGSRWDGANCYFRDAPRGTEPFLYNNRFYATPRRQCFQGSFDGANCLIMRPPEGSKVFIYENKYYYGW